MISFCTSPDVAAKNAVIEPTTTITINERGLFSNSHEDRNSKYIPAVTRVAAWIKADTGVGNCVGFKYSSIFPLLADAPLQN